MPNGDAVALAVLLSLRPRFAHAVATGEKRVELRRRFPAVVPGTRLVIYCTLPVGAIVGTAEITAVNIGSPHVVWDLFGADVGLTRTEFDSYFAGADCARALTLSHYAPLAVPISLCKMRELGIKPPQGFIYLSKQSLAAVMRAGGSA